MSVCAAAPPPCLPLEKSANFVLKFRLIAETSNRRNVHPVSVTFRRFAYSAIRLYVETTVKRFVCTCRNDGKAIRRQRFSAFRLHVAIGSADRRFGGKSVNKAYLYLYRRDAGSAATFRRFVCTLRADRGNYSVRRAIRRIGGLP